MGYENREYFRDGSYSRRGGGDFMTDAPMCKRILIITVVVFLAQMFLTRPARLADMQPAIDRQEAEIAQQEALYGNEFYDENGIPRQIRQRLNPELLVSSAQPVSIVQDWLKLDTDKVLGGQVWRLITSAFCEVALQNQLRE